MVRQEIIQEKKDQIAKLIEEIKKWPDEAQMHLIEEILNSSIKDIKK